MMPDIFSSFDVYEYQLMWLMPNMIVLMPLLIFVLLLFNNYWLSMNRYLMTLVAPMNIIFTQLMRTNSKHIKAYSITIFNLFIILLLMNLMGMIPYSLSITTHLMLTLSLGFPLWFTIILSSLMFNKKEFIAKLLPDGAPNWLNPFLVLIETISILVRPLTLSFRLAANMTAGHIVLSLLGIYTSLAMCTSIINSLLLILMSISYILFEFAICMIQAYIFCLLLSLYTDDHSN